MRPHYPNQGGRDFSPPPPPPPDMPPLPPGPPPGYGPNHGRDSWRPPPNQFSLPQSDFSFRNVDSAPRYPRYQDADRPIHPRDRPRNQQQRPPQRGPQQNRGGFDGNRYSSRPFRGRNRVLPSDRPLLQHHNGNPLEERTLGVDTSGQKYMSIDDVSDSEEENMDVSESDRERNGADDNGHEDGNETEPPKKKRVISTDGAQDGNTVPKWSNPDPYSVLPPVDDGVRKRKDPVKLIRKAFKPVDQASTAQNQVAANDDFISFDDDDKLSASSKASSLESNPGPQKICLDLGNGSDVIELPPSYGDQSLGSRKRTFDDEIKIDGRPTWTSPANPSGSLLDEWVPHRAKEATPWLKAESTSVMKLGFRLHREICDFYAFVRPQPFEQRVREGLLSRLQNTVNREYPGCTVRCFGSFAAGLYLPNADMDLVVNSNTFESSGQKIICQSANKMHKFADFLRRAGMCKSNLVDVIAKAKVPIIKFIDSITGIRVDVSFENNTGIVANNTFAAWKAQYPAMPILVTVIKQFLMMRGLNEVQHGGLGGFSVTCLVVSLLQNMPRVQAGALIPEHNLGEMLIEFLDFYGNRIDVSRTGISMNPPGYFDKNARSEVGLRGPTYQADKASRLAIIDPNRPENDISGGSRNVMFIFERFARAHSEIMSAMKSLDRPSLLDWLLGGNYQSFEEHRARLHDLHQGIRPSERYSTSSSDDFPVRGRPLNEVQISPRAKGQQRQEPRQEIDCSTINANSQKSTNGNIPSSLDKAGSDPLVETDLGQQSRSSIEVETAPTNSLSKRVQRANELRANFPGIKDIPLEISSNTRQLLIRKYAENCCKENLTDNETRDRLQRSRFLKHRHPNMLNLPTFLNVQTTRTVISGYLRHLRAHLVVNPGGNQDINKTLREEIIKTLMDYEARVIDYPFDNFTHAFDASLHPNEEFLDGSENMKARADCFKRQQPDISRLPNLMSKATYRAFVRQSVNQDTSSKRQRKFAHDLRNKYSDVHDIPDMLNEESKIALDRQLSKLPG